MEAPRDANALCDAIDDSLEGPLAKRRRVEPASPPRKVKLVRHPPSLPPVAPPPPSPTTTTDAPDPENGADADSEPEPESRTPPPIPKMTIRIPPATDSPPGVDGERGSPIPKVTIKLARDQHPPVPKMTIRIPRDAGSPERADASPPVPKLTIRIPPDAKPRDASPIPKMTIKIPHDEQSPDERHEPIPKMTIKISDREPTVPKLTIKIPHEFEDANANEPALAPLEIDTSARPTATVPNDAGQASPRIILKINKNSSGSTSEILTENSSKKLEVARADASDEYESESPSTDENADREPTSNSLVCPIKLKLNRESNFAKIVDPPPNDAKSLANRLGRSTVKRTPMREDSVALIRKCASIDKTLVEAKELKLDRLLSNSNLTITRVSKSKSELESLLTNSVEPDVTVSVMPNDSVEKRSPEFCRKNSVHALLLNAAPEIDIELPDFLSRIEESKSARKPAMKRSTRISNKLKRRNEMLEFGNNVNDIVNVRNELPRYKLDSALISLNEGSSSQECMIVDDLSQDPLDIGNAAKAHFSPIVQQVSLASVNNNIVNIVDQMGIDVNAKLTPSTPRRGRGRPRKIVTEMPTIPTPVSVMSVERNLRKSRTPRDMLAIRPSRGRGRGRGSKRGLLRVCNINIPSESPIEMSPDFFSDICNTSDKSKDCNGEVLLSSQERSRSKINSLQQNESNSNAVESDVSTTEITSPSDYASDGFSTRGRNRGRGRGVRRSRGGRTPRLTKSNTRNVRGTRLGKFYEEVQLQEPMPSSDSKNYEKNKIESSRTLTLELFEEETCMMGDNEHSLRTATLIDEESHESETSTAAPESTKCKKSRVSEIFEDGNKEWTAADVAEYDWPPTVSDSPPQTYMIQEQVALYLGIKSFKRKYPDLHRRSLEPEERKFLLAKGLISETLSNLGVTAIDAGEVLDIMFTDFPNKYEDYRQHLRETRDTRAANRPPPQLTTEKSKQETLERALESASSWNSRLNKQRRTMRSAVVDLQTLTLHRPRRPHTIVEKPNVSHYPVALLPGQYTDYYQYYSPEELKYFPLNTVLNVIKSPMRLEEGIDSPFEESAEDSDAADSSSEDSDSESSEQNFKRRNVNTKTKKNGSCVANDASVSNISRPTSPSSNSQTQPASSIPPPVEVPRCKLCNGTEHANRRYPTETFIICATCQKKVHPSCLEMTSNVAKCVRQYAWQCPDCKCCARCEDLADDDKMLFCDLCDRGYHIYCVGLKKVPTGRWHCSHCAVCRSCGARSPSGPSDTTSIGSSEQWHHHLKKTSSGQKVYSHTLCGPCARAWRAGRYCSLCERCFMGKKGALKVVICVNCDRTHHKECVKQPGRTLDVLNYMCNGCRRGNTPRKHITPRKYVRRRISQPSANIVSDTSRSTNVQNNIQNEGLSMDLSVDSICTNDSTHQSNSTCGGTFEGSIKNICKPIPNKTESVESSNISLSILQRQLTSKSKNIDHFVETENIVKTSSNHIQNENHAPTNNCRNDSSSDSLSEKQDKNKSVSSLVVDKINVLKRSLNDSTDHIDDILHSQSETLGINSNIETSLLKVISEDGNSYNLNKITKFSTFVDDNRSSEDNSINKPKSNLLLEDVQYANDSESV